MNPVAHFQEVRARVPPGPTSLDASRAGGLARLATSGFPGRKDEDWKYTQAARLLATPWAPRPPGDGDALLDRAIGSGFALVDGRVARRPAEVPDGVRIAALTDAERPAPVEIPAEVRGFDALNAAFLTDGVAVEIADGVEVDGPIHVSHASTGGDRLNAVRVAIRAGRGSRATVVEHWLGHGASLTTAVTAVEVGEGAELTHVRVQDEDPEGGHHVGSVYARHAAGARLRSWVLTVGGAVSRVDLRSELAGEGAEVALHGLYLLRGRQHADHHTHVAHAVGRTHSRERYKGIVDDHARGVFTGRIRVAPGAQRIDSAQANHNLLLSREAVVNSRPQLEIFADDVKCAHGATIGRLDPEALFYLRARGLPAADARSLLTFAFAHEVLDPLGDGPVRDALRERVRRWLEAR